MRLPLLLSACLAASAAQAQLAGIGASALVTAAYDGDTLTVEALVWPNLAWTGAVRVRGVDTPEIRGRCPGERERAIAARDFTRGLTLGVRVALEDVENDLYGGRVLATVRLPDGTDLAARLIGAGLGLPYGGGTRPDWCGPRA